MKKLFKLGIILCLLRWLFVVFSVVTIVALAYKAHIFYCCANRNLWAALAEWEVVKFLLTACFGLLTLYVAGRQLKKQTDLACINSLTKLRELLTSENNRRVHFALMKEKEQRTLGEKDVDFDKFKLCEYEEIPLVDVYNYIGTIELGANMVKEGLIDLDTFYNQFGYRMEYVYSCPPTEAQQKVRAIVDDNKSYHKDWNWIVKKMRKKGKIA